MTAPRKKKFSILSKKVNDLFVDRPNFFVTLHYHLRWYCNVGFGSANSNKFGLHSLLHHICHRENQARFLQPLGVTKIPLKGNKKRDRPTPLPLPLRRGATAKIGSASTKPKASFRSVFGLRDLCVTAKIGSASTKPKASFRSVFGLRDL